MHLSSPQFTYCPDSQKTFIVEGYWGCRVFLLSSSLLHPFLSPILLLIHPLTPSGLTCLLRSSIILVIWIFFLPIVPVSFFFFSFWITQSFLLLFSLSLCLSSLLLFAPFSLHSCTPAISYLSCFFFLFVPITSKIPASVPARQRGRVKHRISIKWNEIWQNSERGKNI